MRKKMPKVTLIINPEQLERIIKEGIWKLNLFSSQISDPVDYDVYVYRKGKKICAKIILK